MKISDIKIHNLSGVSCGRDSSKSKMIAEAFVCLVEMQVLNRLIKD